MESDERMSKWNAEMAPPALLRLCETVKLAIRKDLVNENGTSVVKHADALDVPRPFILAYVNVGNILATFEFGDLEVLLARLTRLKVGSR